MTFNIPRILFAGTPELAAIHLQSLITAGFCPTFVLTQPDRISGRGRNLRPSPVKEIALQHNIQLWQPEKVRQTSFIDQVVQERFDLILVVAYGQILATRMINSAKIGSFNIHTSLLPRWRGASPIESALLAGDQITGVSLQQILPELDAGPIVAQQSLLVADIETKETLYQKLAHLGTKLLIETLPSLIDRSFTLSPQNSAEITFCHKFSGIDAQLDFNRPAEELMRKIRALNDEPGTWVNAFLVNGKIKRLRLKMASVVKDTFVGDRPVVGTVLNKPPFLIVCGQDLLQITVVQPETKAIMSSNAFFSGNPITRVEPCKI